MTVWVVEYDAYGDQYISKVFRTEELALRFTRGQMEYRITEMEVE